MTDNFDPYFEWLGIGPQERPADHYRLLGLPRFENRSDAIRAAADHRMSHVRKYQTGPKSLYTQQILNDLAAAKMCLLDSATKAAYDAALRSGETAKRPAPGPDGHASGPRVSPVRQHSQSRPQYPAAAQTGGVGSAPVSTGVPGVDSPDAEIEDYDEESLGPVSPAVWLMAALTGVLFLLAGLVAALVVLSWNGDEELPGGDDSLGPVDTGHDERPVEPPEIDGSQEKVVVWPEAGGEVNLSPSTAVLHGGLRLETRAGDDFITNWRSHDSMATWHFKILDPGIYHIRLRYAVTPNAKGAVLGFALGDQQHSHTVSVRGGPGVFITDEFFMAIRRTGEHSLSCWTERPLAQGQMDLRSVQLSKKQ
jgi:hypothetical protein